MVRLHSSETGESVHPHVLDKLLNTNAAGSKRSRAQTKSSLDFKLPDTSNNRADGEYPDTLTAELPKTADQKSKGISNTNDSNKNSEQQLQRPKIATRARGSSGIPPRKTKLDLSDLQGMSEQQIMEALYADPELAELAAEQISKVQKQQKRRPTAGVGASDSSETNMNDGVRIDKPAKVEKGIPYEQWALLLFLMGVGFFQLYKSMSGPLSKPLHGSKKDTSSSSKGKHRGGTTKSKKTNRNAASSTAAKRGDVVAVASRNGSSNGNHGDDVDKVVAEIEGTVMPAVVDEAQTKVKKAKAKKKKKAMTTSGNGNASNGTSTSLAEDSIPLSDAGTTLKPTEPSGESDKAGVAKVAPIHPTIGVISAADYSDVRVDEDVWETVTKSKHTVARVANKQAEEPSSKTATKGTNGSSILPPVSTTAEQSQSLQSSTGKVTGTNLNNMNGDVNEKADTPTDITIKNAVEAKSEGVNPVKSDGLDPVSCVDSQPADPGTDGLEDKGSGKTSVATSKKKKKKKATNGNNKKDATDTNTADDAALAFQLHQYEEKMAALEQQKEITPASDDEVEDDDWAQVPIKRNKKKDGTKVTDTMISATAYTTALTTEMGQIEMKATDDDDDDDD